jgi:hypothetical protein
MGRGEHTSTSRNDLYQTPPEVFEPILEAFDRRWFDFDPCPGAQQPLPARRLLEDGLAEAWPARGLGPPFSALRTKAGRAWLTKCVQAEEAVLLTKAAASAGWFHDHVLGAAQGLILPRGRIRFYLEGEPAPAAATFATSLAYFGPRFARLVDVFTAQSACCIDLRNPYRAAVAS